MFASEDTGEPRVSQGALAPIQELAAPTQQEGLAVTGAIAKPGFDYATLDPDVAGEARDAADRIRALGQRQNEAIIAIGEELVAVKDKLHHGHFGAWLKVEFGMGVSTAERYMRVAKTFAAKIVTVTNLKPSTLYLLSAKSTPAPVRQEIIKRLNGGEPISDRDVRQCVAEAIEKAADVLANVTPRTKARWEAREAAQKAHREEEERVGRENTEAAAHILIDRLGPDLDRFLELADGIWFPELKEKIGELRRGVGTP